MDDVRLFHDAIGITANGRRVRVYQNPTDNCYGYYAMSPPGWCCYYFKDGRPGMGGSDADQIVEVINPDESSLATLWMNRLGPYPGDDELVAEMMRLAALWWDARGDQIDAAIQSWCDDMRDLCEAMRDVA